MSFECALESDSSIYLHDSSNYHCLILHLKYEIYVHLKVIVVASFLDQGLFLEMWGGWMLSSDVAGVLQEAGDAYSRART